MKAVRGGKNERGGMSPMAATHHSQLNDAIFFPPFPASFPWERQGGGVVSAGVQSNGVKQSSYPSGGTEETYVAAGQGETSGSAITYLLRSPSCFLRQLKQLADRIVFRTTVACKKGLQTSIFFLRTRTFIAEECIFTRVAPLKNTASLLRFT